MATGNKYVLCRPQSGLNDNLVRIEVCCRYAQQYGRKLIVDTNFYDARTFRDRFSNYFSSKNKNIILDIESVEDDLDQLSVYPHSLQGQLFSYKAEFKSVQTSAGIRRAYWSEAREPMWFDTNKDYEESVLVFHGVGGGELSSSALNRLEISDSLYEELLKRLKLIGRPYSGVHIRNTDLQNSYFSQMKKIGSSLKPPYFLATDSAQVVSDFADFLGKENVFNFSRSLSEDGSPIHLNTPQEQSYQNNCDAILDLLMLGLSEYFAYTKLKQNTYGVERSGFARLAEVLNLDKSILENVIGRPNGEISRYLWSV